MSLTDTQTYSGRRTTALAILLAFIASLLVVSTALAEEPSPDFRLQGDVTTDEGGFVDWDDFLEADANGDVTPISDPPTQAGYIAVGASPDHALPDASTYQGGGSKDINPIEDWRCTTRNNVNSKVDILNAYSVAQRNDDDHLIVYFGAEIREPEGNSNIGLWLLQDDNVGCEGRGGFGGAHVDGDLLVVSAFTDGGRTSNVTVYEWVQDHDNPADEGSLQLRGDFANATCEGGTLGDEEACAIANSEESVDTPWNSPDKSGDLEDELEPNTFFEGGINISKVLGSNGDEPCITQFLTNTRSSQSLNAQLFDYTIGDLNVCGNLTIVKETDPSAVDRDFDFEIEGPSFEGAESFTLNAGDPETDPEEQVPDQITFNDIVAGDYTITEDVPEGWDLVSIACDNGATVDLAEGSVVVEVGLEANVTCTFTNRLRHSIVVEKVDDDGAALEGAEFALHEDDDGTVGDKVGDLELRHDHLFCIDNLEPGDYWVVETVTPPGFQENDPVDVETSSTETCDQRFDADGTLIGDPADATVINIPDPRDVIVTKLKDGADDVPLAGFTFEIFEGHDADPADDTTLDTQTTAANGEAVFESLAPGDYTVCEVGAPDPSDYWAPELPVCENITIDIGDPAEPGAELTFVNEPLSRVQVLFFNETGFTSATITCVDEADDPVGEPITVEGADEAEELDHLPLGDYDCRIEIRNGAQDE